VALARKSLDQALLAPELSDPEHCWRGCNGEEAIGLEILKKIKEKKVYVFSFITTPNDTPYNTSPQHSSSGPLYITKPASSKDRSVFEGYGEQSAVKLVVCERTTVQDGCQCIVVIGDAIRILILGLVCRSEAAYSVCRCGIDFGLYNAYIY
jgi:hypothetical protein